MTTRCTATVARRIHHSAARLWYLIVQQIELRSRARLTAGVVATMVVEAVQPMAVRTTCGMTSIISDGLGIRRRNVCQLAVIEIFTATARFTICPRCDRADLNPPPDGTPRTPAPPGTPPA